MQSKPFVLRLRSWSALAWNLSTTLALVSIGLVVLAILLTGAASELHIIDKLAVLIPQPLRQWFDQPTNYTSPQLPEGVKKAIAQATPKPTERRKGAGFSIGSTEAEVLRIQGRPNRTSSSTWFYGESEVHFLGGHVVAWRNSPRNPLRIQQ